MLAGQLYDPMDHAFFCDYGTNIELGERVFNFNCVVLDVFPVPD
jgi:maltose O-acetyltransferase